MCKIILITHQKGGVGKSTLTFNLALNLADSAKVAIIDFDAQGSLMQLQSTTKTMDILESPADLNSISSLRFDFIFIDTPPYLSSSLPQLIRIADLIVVPTKAGVLDLMAITNTIELINQTGGLKKTMIVLNMVKPNTTLTLDILIELNKLEASVAKTHISDLVSFTRSVIQGGLGKNDKAISQIDNLTREILTKLLEQ
ncbi:chromosome partitioning protein [Nonlabens sp. Hel1_33_55]|uniref:ParA family protein n=1 Tax=Nonlabens sp. Hel1_33_55 TaxID=1336802 RepID=UPI000875CE1A|nr:ParA family protein [Nonlabens sp. Hel1_33_55]SCY00567.1 chromosome partitioning protein [Nonlabens sp. Hel1_33_55]